MDRGRWSAAIGPYIPLTTSPNETIAAYIYFDGRAKEEVATLLRRGEETWVNSRWVGVPDSEGGGLAEREFLFREVGLERWLNGLDLTGKDAAKTIEKRKQKLERQRRKKKEAKGSDDEVGPSTADSKKSVLKYGSDGDSPIAAVSDDEGSSSGSGSSDDDPIPETAGQIKVALFRVLASGEIKRGEYSPQFDAHDDDEASQNGHAANGDGGNDADVDHTTSFAKPKTLDPKSISTQTVTGIDPTDKPYAVFTFLYRGERQLQKMGILPAPKAEKTPTAAKRKSVQDTLATLGPLKKEGTVGFSGFRERDAKAKSRRKHKKTSEDEMESDSDEEDEGFVGKTEDVDDAEIKKEENGLLSPEDAEKTGELAEGVRKIKVGSHHPSPYHRKHHSLIHPQLKRQHSAEPLTSNGIIEARKNSKSNTPSLASTPKMGDDLLSATPPLLPTTTPIDTTSKAVTNAENDDFVGSPMKKHRASLPGFDDETLKRRLGGGMSAIGDVIGSGADQSKKGGSGLTFGGAIVKQEDLDDRDEEL